jgi:hypothetical protein
MRTKVALSLVLTALIALFAAGSAQAALTVANQNDSGAGSLRQAIAEAGSGETINVPAGTYTLTSAPLEIAKKSLTIAGHGSGDTIVRAGAPFRVFELLGPLNLNMSGITIRDGNLAGPSTFGAGIRAIEANIGLSGVAITNNVANSNGAPGNSGGVAQGGAIWMVKGSLSLTDSQVTGNTATAVGAGEKAGGVTQGGAIWAVEAPISIVNSTVSGNLADARGGQGPAGSQPGGVSQGGAIWSANAPLTLTGTPVSGNSALASAGPGGPGGVSQGGSIWTAGSLSLAGSSLAGNRADARGGQGPASGSQAGGVAQGGGIWAAQNTSGSSTVDRTAISGNLVDASAGPGANAGVATGGGLWLVAEKAPTAFVNATIASNTARAQSATGGGVVQGGGMWGVTNEAGSISLTASTVSGNAIETPAAGVAMGGNLFFDKRLTARNTIVANGTAPAGKENCNEPVNPAGGSGGFNIDSTDQCGFKAVGDKVNTDPQLGPLQSNGGPTQTMVPALGSPAIDQGRSFGVSGDQRGVIRPIDLPTIPNSPAPGADGSDIGAVEVQPSNAFTLGKLTRNKKKGTATLTVLLPAPSAGTLTLSGKGLKTQTLAIAGETEVKLKVALASKKLRKALRKKGKRKVGINVTYAPTGNSAATQSRKAKLIKKKKRHRKHQKPAKS